MHLKKWNFIKFPSCLAHSENDGGRLDGVEGKRREGRDDRTSPDCSTDRDLLIRSDDIRVHRAHRSSDVRPTFSLPVESHGSRQTAALRGVLFLRYG